MTARVIALALALLSLGAGASLAAVPCCPETAPSGSTLQRPDCCAAEVSCPIRTPTAIVSAARAIGAGSSPTAPVPAPLAPSAVRTTLAARPTPLGRAAPGPPIYRLHAQLLI